MLDVEPFKDAMNAVLELRKSVAFLFWKVPSQLPVVVATYAVLEVR